MDSSKKLSLSDVKNISALYDGMGEGDSAMRSYADSLYGNLMEQIADFEETLKDDEEIGAYLPSFGREILICIENVGYHNPDFIIYYGTLVDENTKVQLVQHLSQINIMFVAVKARELNGKPKRLGFRVGG